MIEKLLENWLDSATERSYQSVFVQILCARGYRVVHSTRHTALEYGKDVLAIAPDGSGCAYQLKGNPGGKLSLIQFRKEVQPQLVQLISQPVVYPGFPEGPHKAYLVSNGYFEEEVIRAIDDLNRGPYPSKITLISRGDLLTWSKELGELLWPSELIDVRIFLEIFLHEPDDLLPIKKLSHLISRTLRLGTLAENIKGKPELERLKSSAALLTGIATYNFAERENHYAVISAWTLFAISVIAATEKHQYLLDGKILDILNLSLSAIKDALVNLWDDVKKQHHLVEGNALADPEVFYWRFAILLGLMSCLAFMDEAETILSEEDKTDLRKWLIRPPQSIIIWGEGAVAHIAPWIIWLRSNDATLRPDREIARLAEKIIQTNQYENKSALANPYYSFEEFIRSRMKLNASEAGAPTIEEKFDGNSFTAEAIMHLLVRTNLKQTCKSLWPDFTKINHRTFTPDYKWQYCVLKSDEGADQTKIYPYTYEWAELQKDALKSNADSIPAELLARPCLLALWWLVAPYRYNSISCSAFVDQVLPNWGRWGF